LRPLVRSKGSAEKYFCQMAEATDLAKKFRISYLTIYSDFTDISALIINLIRKCSVWFQNDLPKITLPISVVVKQLDSLEVTK
jgi:hypothetical protein